MDSNYGKSPDNPIQLNSIPASRFFLNHLITPEGCHIIYHRPGSLSGSTSGHPIDHYELMAADNQYHDLYINIYNETNIWIPPEGFLFDEEIRFYPEGIDDYDVEEINEPDLIIEDQFILFEKPFDDLEDEFEDDLKSPSVLDMFLCYNFGVNSKVADFPNALIVEAIEPGGDPEDGIFPMIFESIKPRESQPIHDI